jgi:hypothetical protein
MLNSLKIDLGITTDVYDERLAALLGTAKDMIAREGVEFADDLTLEDQQLITMYAAWMWRNRDSMTGMPRMLRLALNNRIFGEKMKDD